MKKVYNENEFTNGDFLAVSRRCHYNQFIAEFYEEMAEEQSTPMQIRDGTIVYGKDPNLLRRAERLKACCKSWDWDMFGKSKVKSLVRVERCHDRFCLNCQALEADQRYAQYASVLDGYAKTNDLYHVVLTVPNVEAAHLAETVTLMLDRFAYMIRFFDGRKGIRGVNFKQYGYRGAVRELEITVKRKNNTFHPHLHTVFILNKDMYLPAVWWNGFSEDKRKRKPTRLFSDFELLLQRLWCLLIMREKVTKYNIEHIGEVTGYADGFSCIADKTNGNYHEIFKYAIKGTFKERTLFTGENFRTLYAALFGRRAYQTFGCLQRYDFNDVDVNLGLGSKDEVFEMYLGKLLRVEKPERITEILSKMLENTSEHCEDKYHYLSKATYVRHFKSLTEEEKGKVLDSLLAD